MKKRVRESRKLRVGDLVRIPSREDSIGLVIKECYIDRDIMHPLPGVEAALAVKVQWLDNSRGEAIGHWTAIYYEKALELLQSGPA